MPSTIVENPVFPETDKEIRANRKKYINALRSKKYANQCYGNLFQKTDGKEQRCALGVALTIFFGVKNTADYEDYLNRERDAYGDISLMLGIPQTAHEAGDGELCISDIWHYNDDNALPFPAIGDKLAEDWAL